MADLLFIAGTVLILVGCFGLGAMWMSYKRPMDWPEWEVVMPQDYPDWRWP